MQNFSTTFSFQKFSTKFLCKASPQYFHLKNFYVKLLHHIFIKRFLTKFLCNYPLPDFYSKIRCWLGRLSVMRGKLRSSLLAPHPTPATISIPIPFWEWSPFGIERCLQVCIQGGLSVMRGTLRSSLYWSEIGTIGSPPATISKPLYTLFLYLYHFVNYLFLG